MIGLSLILSPGAVWIDAIAMRSPRAVEVRAAHLLP